MSMPKILIVDDSMAACLFMANALRGVGYEVSIALNEHDLLTRVLTYRPQCLILDVILPGASGFTLCRQLRVIDPQHTLPIILVSTKSSPLDQAYGLRQGADRYLSKPFTAEALVETVWNVLPLHLRPTIMPPSSVPKSPTTTSLDLIPRSRVDSSMLTTSNPFASSVRMHGQVRQVYRAIDGLKTVDELCALLGSSVKEMGEILRTLFIQQYIEFCDKEGKVVDPHRLFSEMGKLS
jgi:chemotaxis family two-component system response regulator PixH